MKILHTADWHLGKSFNSYQLLVEQKQALLQLLEIIKTQKPEVVLLSGDIYDRSVPPADAVKLFDNIISEIILELKTPVIAIAGNHDSPERIGFGSGLLQRQGLHITGSLSLPIKPVILSDDFGEIYFYPIPYTEPETLRYLTQNNEIKSHADVFDWILNHIKAIHPEGKRSILIGHAFVAEAEGEDSDSERTLLVGGAAYVPSQIFEFFNYTALGHLHKPLSFLDGKVKYSGSLMKYSFSEAAYDKSVIMLEIAQNGNFTHERIKIIPQKEVRRVKGEIIQKEFILKDDSTPQKEDFLEVSLLNTEIVANAMQIVQRAYPNTMVLKWPELPKIMNTSRLTTEQVVSMSEIELFEDFYKNFTEKELDNDKKQVIKEVISGIKKIED